MVDITIHKITRIDYNSIPERVWLGKRIKTLREIQNGAMIIPEGTMCEINRKYKGFSLITEPCKCCGVKIFITRVPYYDCGLLVEQGMMKENKIQLTRW